MSENASNSKKSRSQKTSEEDVSLKEITIPEYRQTRVDTLKTKMSSRISNQKRVLRLYRSKINQKVKSTLNKIKDVIFPRDVVYKDQEPPKSFAFKKEFIGIYAFFIIYSLILIFYINIPDETFISIFTLGRPYEFGTTILAFFLFLAFLLSINKIRYWIFDNDKLIITYLKQIIIFPIVFVILFIILSTYILPVYNITSIILFLSMLWLFLLSSRFYSYSRRFSTNIEAKFITKYSKSRSLVASLGPIFIMGSLVMISLFYRTFLVVLALDIFSVTDPFVAIQVYFIEMRLIMPLIYLSLILTFLFIIFEFIFTRRVAETKRAGKFDNFTFSMIVFFIFFFQLMQVSLFLFTRPETVEILKKAFGTTTGSTISAFFLVEFVITMIFLFRILVKTGRTFGWRLLWFKKDGVVLLILTCVFAQTITQYARLSPIENFDVRLLGLIIDFSKFLISILMIIFLGFTLVVYYLKPHETSVFMRMMKETVKEEEKESEQIYGIIRNEYIRRGDAFSLESIEREMIKSTRLPKETIYEIIDHLGDKHFNIHITKKTDDTGKIVSRIIDFVSITEVFERKDLAKKKAKKYLSERLFDTMITEKKHIKLSDEIDTEKASDLFISSLSADYSKKVKEKKQVSIKKNKAQRFLTAKRDISEDIKQEIMEILKKEYLYRIENKKLFQDIHYSISEISPEIQKKTKITIGEIYPLIEELSKLDNEIRLIANPEDQNDKKIQFFPISDDAMCFALTNFRPDEYKEIREEIRQKYIQDIKARRTLAMLKSFKEGITESTDQQKNWLQILDYLIKNYNTYKNNYVSLPSKSKLNDLISTFPLNKKIDVFNLEIKK
ncbi:MAG: hypothetical protein ACFFBP_19365 [Promethearchaeota archaeon]